MIPQLTLLLAHYLYLIPIQTMQGLVPVLLMPHTLDGCKRVINFREEYDGVALKHFYDTFMKKNFPIEDELDPLEVWEEVLDPEKVESFEDQAVELHVVVGYGDSKARDIVGGVVFEYYKMSNCCLMSYIAVADDHRKSGVAKALVQLAEETCQQASSRLKKSDDDNKPWLDSISRVSVNDTTEKLLREVSAMMSPEEHKFMTSNISNYKSGLCLFFAETNAEGVEDCVMDSTVRHKILSRLGFRPLRFSYIQPPLSDDQLPCYDLLLTTLSEKRPIPSAIVRLFLIDFALSVFGSLGGFSSSSWYKQMEIELNASNGVLPQEGLPPWKGRTVKASE
eukprot:TRINITY_DN7998_c0_g1_i1.p1 TRINITY_DN7998_c0_g1~~TRINITY_DN7998_c0_g1_i1.p1  ORF type:complete len:337 (+),score=43.88 TRINITY_DN7998_c0_g1_i1:446-1456(+)